MAGNETAVIEPFSGMPFTIDNVILLLEEKARGLREMVLTGCNHRDLAVNCVRMHEIHASWLKELKQLRKESGKWQE